MLRLRGIVRAGKGQVRVTETNTLKSFHLLFEADWIARRQVASSPHLFGHLLHVQVKCAFDVTVSLHIVLTEPILAFPLTVDGAENLLGRGDYGPGQQQHRGVYRYQIKHQGPGEDCSAAPREMVQRRELVPHSVKGREKIQG